MAASQPECAESEPTNGNYAWSPRGHAQTLGVWSAPQACKDRLNGQNNPCLEAQEIKMEQKKEAEVPSRLI